MKRFRKILFLCTGEGAPNPAFSRAMQMAKCNGAELTAVAVASPRGRRRSKGSSGFDAELRRQAQESLDQLEALATGEGLKLKTWILEGRAFLEVIRLVLREEHDLVIKTAGEPTLSRLFGRTDHQLMRKCPCPVWVFKPNHPGTYTRILAAVDPEPDDKVHRDLNEQILDLAADLAREDKSELHVLHAWSVWEENAARSARISIPREELDAMHEAYHAERRSDLDDLISRVPMDNVDLHKHLVHGEPNDIITEFAAEREVDLIVMGTVCRTGLAGFVIGNNAEQVLEVVDSAVLTLKPVGFETPVQLPEGNRRFSLSNWI